jgi:RNA polymerase primary sigma factor
VVKKKTRLARCRSCLVDAQAASARRSEAIEAADPRSCASARKSAAASWSPTSETGRCKAPVKVAPKCQTGQSQAEPEPVVIQTAGQAVSQTTDAAALAAIDTSGYLLPRSRCRAAAAASRANSRRKTTKSRR